MRIEARAKINWTLDIVGNRADGYHLLEMLMQPVTLSDEVELEKAGTVSLRLPGEKSLSADERNLAWRAASALKQATGYPGGASIVLRKRIPMGAGLGGGSADAAAVLFGLNQLWETGLSQPELERLGLSLGADVPFCLRGHLAMVGGVGEEISPLPHSPSVPLVIVQPCEGLSTGEVFRAYHAAARVDRPNNAEAAEALLSGDWPRLARSMGNALQGVSRAMRPEIGTAIDALYAAGARCAAMSGSGSAVFGAFETAGAADSAAAALHARWEKTYRCETCRESVNILPD